MLLVLKLLPGLIVINVIIMQSSPQAFYRPAQLVRQVYPEA
jgi:hypothetical protein